MKRGETALTRATSREHPRTEDTHEQKGTEMLSKPDLNVRFVVEIEPIGFFNSKEKKARRFARDWRKYLDRTVREVMCAGDYSRRVRVYMVDADTGERIS